MSLKAIAIATVVLVATIAALILYGAQRWQSDTKKLLMRMEAAYIPIAPSTYDPRDLVGLPASVQRYFRAVLSEGQPFVTAVSVEHTGTFNMSEAGEQWAPFTSTQRVVTRRPGFVWDARVRMAPGVTVHVHDAYVAGEGLLTAKLFGLLTVMNQSPTPELAQGELIRFLAEAPWYPTVLLPSQGVTWEEIDDSRASATLADGATTVTLVFQFGADGLISSVQSEGRYTEVQGALVAVPWQGRHWDYELRDGMLVPTEGEVAWLRPDGARPYWRGRISSLSYDLVE
jgi:hypothetical protein